MFLIVTVLSHWQKRINFINLKVYLLNAKSETINHLLSILKMKRTVLILLSLNLTIYAFSQLIVKGNYTTVSNVIGVNAIYLFSQLNNNSVSDATEIHYKSSDPNVLVQWFTFQNGIKTFLNDVNVVSSTETYIEPKNNTGYILSVDGVETSFWVFDYSSYLPNISSITAVDGFNPCEDVEIQMNGNVPIFQYQNTSGAVFALPRKFSLTYNTLKWDNANWSVADTIETITLPATNIFVPVPLTNTNFTLSGDQFAKSLGLNELSVTSGLYASKAVKCNLTTLTTTRDDLNENERPEQTTSLSGSAPLEIQFFSNPTANVQNYRWQIYKDNALVLTRTEQNHQYTFREAGKYTVKLLVSNTSCSDSAFVDISISESSLMAPRIFTPNGDGKNDEFRVVYTSINQFHGTIINRWGRIIFEWTDPAKGWDGKINGKPAPEGTYFYIIDAKGSDAKVYKLKGPINLLR